MVLDSREKSAKRGLTYLLCVEVFSPCYRYVHIRTIARDTSSRPGKGFAKQAFFTSAVARASSYAASRA
jgi:hypothetical protein